MIVIIFAKIHIMKIAVLLKFDEKDRYILDYLNKQLLPLKPEIHLIHVEQISGEVPLKIDGSVIDNCTEFDLSKHQAVVAERTVKMAHFLETYPDVRRVVVAGNPLNFIKYYAKLHEIDFIFAGSHVTSWKEILESTFATQVAHRIDIPMLSLKCDRSEDDLKTIGIVVDGAEMTANKLKVVTALASKHKALIKLIRTPEHLSDNVDVSLFSSDIDVLEVAVPGSVHDHDFHKCTNEHLIDLLVVFRQHPSFWKRLFPSDSNDYLLNHLELPLLIL